MNKSKKQKQIEKLKEEGKTCKEISKILNLSYSVVLYYYNPEYKKSRLQYVKEYRKNNKVKINDKYRKYQKEYQRKYYKKYNEKLKKYHREYEKKRYDRLKEQNEK